MADALMQWETIDKFQIDDLMNGKKIAPPVPEDDDKDEQPPVTVTPDTTGGSNIGQSGLAT
jgi:cell division protease FtsH